MKNNNTFYSRTKANPIFAQCYISECINEPENKMYKYYWFVKSEKNYSSRALRGDEALLVNYLMYNEPERLRQLLDECQLYRYVKRTIRKYKKSVNDLTIELCKNDGDMLLAYQLGKEERYSMLENNNRHRAEEMLQSMLYGK